MTDLAKTAESEGLTHAEAREALKAAGRRKFAPPEMARVMTMAEVAKALGWMTPHGLPNVQRVKRKLRKAGVAFQARPGAHWEVTRNDMRVALRKYWVELEMDAAEQ